MASPWLTPDEEELKAYLASQNMPEAMGAGYPAGGPIMAPEAGRMSPMAVPQYVPYQTTERDKQAALAKMFGGTARNIGRILSGISPGPGAQDTYQQSLDDPRTKHIEDWRARMYGAQLQLQKDQMNPQDTANIKEYGFAVQNGYKGTFEEWVKTQGSDRTGPTAWMKDTEFFESKMGRKPTEDEMWLLKRGPYGFNYGDVPGAMIGPSVRPAVSGAGGGGVPAVGGQPPVTAGATPSPGGVQGQPSPAPPPSGFGAQQAQISRAEADKSGLERQVTNWADQTQKIKAQAVALPEMDSRIGRLRDILTDIDEGKVNSAGFPSGRWGYLYDPETAVIEAESVIQVLDTLKETDLKPISDADISMLKSQFLSALHTPASNQRLIERGIKLIEGSMSKVHDSMDYIYNKSPTGTLEGYDRFVWERRQQQQAEKARREKEPGGLPKWEERGLTGGRPGG